jgi:hypothetical protein
VGGDRGETGGNPDAVGEVGGMEVEVEVEIEVEVEARLCREGMRLR